MFSFLLSETGFALSRHGAFPIRINELIKMRNAAETIRNCLVLAAIPLDPKPPFFAFGC
jgi:hypothetical protein